MAYKNEEVVDKDTSTKDTMIRQIPISVELLEKQSKIEKKEEEPINKNKKMKKEKKIIFEILDFAKTMLIALLVVNILNMFIFSLSTVQQSSMEKTLMSGEQLIIEKVTYQFGNPKRGDIIVFIDEISVDNSVWGRFKRLYDDIFGKLKNQEAHFRLVKRVIGIPGDVINIEEDDLYINGVLIDEPYLNTPIFAKTVEYPLSLGEDEYFVMGDNRAVSYDSRDFGPIKREQIEGRVLFRFWPLNRMGGF